MRRTEEEAKMTRKQLLNAALSVFSQKGYESSRLEDIAEVTGVTRGAIYHHFGSKAELYMALVENASAQGNVLIQHAVEKGGTFVDILSRILISYFSLLEDDSNFREVVTLTLFKTGTSPDLDALVDKRYNEAQMLVESISDFFQKGIDQKQLRSDLDPVTAAQALLAYQNGFAMLWLANQDAFSIKKSAQTLIDIFLHGIAAE